MQFQSTMGTHKTTITNNPLHQNSMKNKKTKKKNISPDAQFNIDLNLCSKTNDLAGATSLFDTSVSANIRLTTHNYNALLHICTHSLSDSALRPSALRHGLRIFSHMSSSAAVVPNEATLTAAARLAAADHNGDRAFELAKSAAAPRLRTFAPALLCFAASALPDRAYAVEAHMALAGLAPEEPELAALFGVSAKAARCDKVYEYLHKLRDCVRLISEPTAAVVQRWFEKGACVGSTATDYEIREAVLRNGGGWHGRGWVGEGSWVVRRGCVESDHGRCSCCLEKLCSVDVGDVETERFAESVASLAMEREAKSNFGEFQDWLEKHADYEAIVDGANIGLYQQNFAEGDFSVSQLNAVVNELYVNCGNKWPLVVLHNKRSRSLLENPSYRELVNEWLEKGILYTTPNGSNDDWYWLYATVKLKCLLVTNDEMRDHIFELLGNSFFLKWKERHQVRYTFVKGNLQLQMPPTYSSVIQESEKGSWHIPIAASDNIDESERTWLCITRPQEASQNSESLYNDDKQINSSLIACSDKSHTNLLDSSETLDNKTTSSTGKRKERSPDFTDNL